MKVFFPPQTRSEHCSRSFLPNFRLKCHHDDHHHHHLYPLNCSKKCWTFSYPWSSVDCWPTIKLNHFCQNKWTIYLDSWKKSRFPNPFGLEPFHDDENEDNIITRNDEIHDEKKEKEKKFYSFSPCWPKTLFSYFPTTIIVIIMISMNTQSYQFWCNIMFIVLFSVISHWNLFKTQFHDDMNGKRKRLNKKKKKTFIIFIGKMLILIDSDS